MPYEKEGEPEMNKSKRWIALAIAAVIVAALTSSPLVQAAGKLIVPRGSVGTPQLKAGAVTGLKVKDGSLAAADFKAGELPAGAQGPKGDTGAAGPPGMSGYQTVYGPITNIAPGGTHLDTVNCPAGKKVINVGFIGGGDGMGTILSIPTDAGGGGWYLRVKNLGAIAATTYQPIVICVNVA
jgi:hypothetical protein